MDLNELLETLIDYSNNCIPIKTETLLNTINSIDYLRVENVSTDSENVELLNIFNAPVSYITKTEINIRFINTLDGTKYDISAIQVFDTCLINNIICNY